MNGTPLRLALLVAVVTALSAAGGYWLASRSNHSTDAAHVAEGAGADRKVLYWYDPMVPAQHFDKPGKSPFMDMQLVPKYADEADAAAGIRIDPGVVQNLGIRYAVVERGNLSQPVDAVGSIGFNQRTVAEVQARAGGFVERVYGRAPGDVVAQHAPLVDLLVPEWAGAQTEWLALRNSGDAGLIAAARQRLVLLGMPVELISQVERSGQQRATFTVTAPIAGAIESLDVRLGMSVSAGAPIARINGLDTVWLEATVPEAQSGLIRAGQSVTAQLAAYAGEEFKGSVIAVLPETSVETRTLRVRVELPNPQARLKPGMFARVHFDAGDSRPVLFVPSEAVIRTGTRSLVIVAAEGGRFAPTEIQIGQDIQGRTAVLSGLNEEQRVVASGQFLIDSEAGLQGVLARLRTDEASPTSAAVPAMHEATGTVESISENEIVLVHGPVTSLGWEAMTMQFKLHHPQLALGLKAGDAVHFRFRKQDDGFVIEQLHRLEGGQ